jgi:cell division protease FtsH
MQGRVAILKVHSKGKALAKDVDFEKIARRTPGFTGADLQNLMNEAAIMAARRDLKEISKEEIADALERIIAGPEKVPIPFFFFHVCCHVLHVPA